MVEFIVIDKKTGKEADAYQIALKEEWAKGLIYCDMEGFAIEGDGSLVLLDECGNVAYCPSGRFTVQYTNKVVIDKEAFETQITAECMRERVEFAKEIIDKVDDMIGGKLIAQALREIYLGEEE